MTQEIIKTNNTKIAKNSVKDFSTLQRHKENEIFQNLNNYTLGHAIEQYLLTLKSTNTKKTYEQGFKRLNDLGILRHDMSLQLFALANLNNIVDSIKQVGAWSEATRQARAACFIAFSKFLARKTENIVKGATPERTGTNKTFSKIRSKVKTEALTLAQAKLFIETLTERSNRDGLIAKLCLQGAKRIEEVLSVRIDQVSWDKKTIEFTQSKSKSEDSTIISFDHKTMSELSQYIGGRAKGLVFISARGEKVHRTQINRAFAVVSKTVLGKKISPHTLRATAITEYKRMGYNYEDIQKISGHKTLSQLGEYDKTEKENNPSKKISLLT